MRRRTKRRLRVWTFGFGITAATVGLETHPWWVAGAAALAAVPVAVRQYRLHRPERTAMYILYGEAGEVLYVGISVDPQQRWQQHEDDKPWWPEVTETELVAWHRTRAQALKAEASAIHEFQPVYNATHNYGNPGRVDWREERRLEREEHQFGWRGR